MKPVPKLQDPMSSVDSYQYSRVARECNRVPVRCSYRQMSLESSGPKESSLWGFPQSSMFKDARVGVFVWSYSTMTHFLWQSSGGGTSWSALLLRKPAQKQFHAGTECLQWVSEQPQAWYDLRLIVGLSYYCAGVDDHKMISGFQAMKCKADICCVIGVFGMTWEEPVQIWTHLKVTKLWLCRKCLHP